MSNNFAPAVDLSQLDELIQEEKQRVVAKSAGDRCSAATYEDIVNISDKGVFTGISMNPDTVTGAADFVRFKITIDGVLLVSTSDYFYYGAVGDQRSLSFNHRFNTSLRVEHYISNAADGVYSTASWTIDA